MKGELMRKAVEKRGFGFSGGNIMAESDVDAKIP
jgi:hypothetical protein